MTRVQKNRLRALTLVMLGSLAGSASCAGDPDNPPAIEFPSHLQWLNVERPLTLKDLRGKVVILDFWTYGCVNCIHIMADLEKLELKYGDRIAVIGVHSPKFDNEKNLETLRNIVVRYDRRHPIVNDTEWWLMRNYGARAWPTLVVIDPAGGVLGKVSGEGHYDLLDKAVEDLLKKFHDSLNRSPLPLALEQKRYEKSLLAAPGKLAVSDDLVGISDTLHHRVVITDHGGRILKTFGGPAPGFADGSPDAARFSDPQGLLFADQGVYVADTGNHAIRFIDLKTDKVRTIAGTGRIGFVTGGEHQALEVSLRSPWALARDAHWLYVAMAGSHQIWRMDVGTGRIGPYAGSGAEGIADGPLSQASFSQPSGLSLVGGMLYVADAEASAVRRIDLKAEQVSTLVGTGLFDFGDRDGLFREAMLQHTLGITVTGPRTVMLADTYNHKLKRMDLDRGVVSTVAGTGEPGRTLPQMNEPGGLALLGESVLIADTNNHRILKYDPASKRLSEWHLTHGASKGK